MKSLLLKEETYRTNPKLAWFLLILALLINFLLLFLLFVLQTENTFFSRSETNPEEAPIVFEQMSETPEPQEPPPTPPTNEVAALKPGASNFGIPDEYKEDEMIAHINEREPDKKETQPELAATQEAQQKEQNEKLPSQQNSDPLTHAKEQEVAQPQPIIPTHNEKTLEKPQQPEAPIKQKLQPNQPVQPAPESPQKIKAPLQKELTFNDIAKGFLSSLDEGGNDLVERKGNENIRPDFEEMRILSYQHKLFWYMQNEWNRNNVTLNFPVPPFSTTGISITIDKDGNLKKIAVIHSCGIQQLDDAIAQGIRAASPYPPLPSFLKKDSYTFNFGVKHIQKSSSGFNNQLRR